MNFDIFNYVLGLVGIFLIWATVTKPVFYWESRRIEGVRDLIGDKATEVGCYVIGGLFLVGGVLAVTGLIELF